MKIRCLECGEQFEPEARERICSAGCRDARRSRMARRSDKRHGKRRASYLPRPEPVEMAVVLPFNPASPFLTDEQRRVCAGGGGVTTESRIKAVLAATPEQLAAVDAVLAGTAAAPCRVLRRRAVAAMLGCSPRTVDALRRAGHIRAVRLPGRRNVAGFVEAEVIALVNQEVKS